MAGEPAASGGDRSPRPWSTSPRGCSSRAITLSRPGPSWPSPRSRLACTSRLGSCCRSRWSCGRRWPCSTGSSRTSTWCPTLLPLPTPSTSRLPRPAAGRPCGTSASATRCLSGRLVGRQNPADEAIPAAETRRYSGHSLRRGGSTSMLAAGAQPLHVSRHGRWSDGARSFAGYVEEATGFGDANPTKGLLLREGRRRRRRTLVHQGG
jgi:hypothetical protein